MYKYEGFTGARVPWLKVSQKGSFLFTTPWPDNVFSQPSRALRRYFSGRERNTRKPFRKKRHTKKKTQLNFLQGHLKETVVFLMLSSGDSLGPAVDSCKPP